MKAKLLALFISFLELVLMKLKRKESGRCRLDGSQPSSYEGMTDEEVVSSYLNDSRGNPTESSKPSDAK